MGVNLSTTELVDRANEVSIHRILTDYCGMEVPESPEGRSYKTRCPFAFEHGDSGVDRSYRVYTSSNTSYCFDVHGLLLPVRLVAIRFDLTYRRSALRILERYGVLNPKPWWERYATLVKEQAEKEQDLGSPVYLVEALHSAMREHPAYLKRAYDADVLSFIEARLDDLERLYASHVSPEEVRVWYRQTREQTLGLLGEDGDGHEYDS